MKDSLVDIETRWSLNDLADATEMINWQNAGIRAEQERLRLEQANKARGR